MRKSVGLFFERLILRRASEHFVLWKTIEGEFIVFAYVWIVWLMLALIFFLLLNDGWYYVAFVLVLILGGSAGLFFFREPYPLTRCQINKISDGFR